MNVWSKEDGKAHIATIVIAAFAMPITQAAS